MDKEIWDKAPEGATHYTPSIGLGFCPVFWRSVNGVAVEAWAMSDDHETVKEHFTYDKKGCPGFKPEKAFARYPEHPSWDGTGLPPVGAVCELRMKHGGWGEAKIKYHGRAICVWLWNRHDGNDEQSEHAANPDRMEFRPIRTPEQIAAEERQKAVDQMLADYQYTVGPCTHGLVRSQAERLYDVGYRKIEN